MARQGFAPRTISPEKAALILQASQATKGFTDRKHVHAVLSLAHRFATAILPAGTDPEEIEIQAMKEAISTWQETTDYFDRLAGMLGSEAPQ